MIAARPPGIPRIDLTDTSTSAGAARVTGEIRHAFEEVGVAVVTGHGIPPATIQRMLETTREFFRLPLDQKRKAAARPPSRFRGYCSAEDSVPAGELPYELWESYEFNRYDEPADAISGGYSARSSRLLKANIWPPEPADFPAVCREYFSAIEGLMYRFLELCDVALDLDSGWFGERFSPHCSYLSLNYYPPQERPPETGQLRQVPHTDIAGPTFLYQDGDAGGLQIEGPGDTWTPVSYEPGAYVVFMADLMARWTNDRWRSARHRVVNPRRTDSAQDRVSLAYFSYPKLDTTVEVAPTCRSVGETPRYEPMTVVDWVARRMNVQ